MYISKFLCITGVTPILRTAISYSFYNINITR
nr:MAG TPA: hypothetical protein [Caudoviricetes sp.]